MAGSLNKVTLIGNVGKDPEIRSLTSGDRVANFSLATSETWTDKRSGEKKERTEWHRVCCFNDGLVGVIEKYVRKGTKLYIEGALQTRKWEKDGRDNYSTEVVLQRFNGTLILLGGRDDGERSDTRDDGYSRGGGGSGGYGESRGYDETRPREDFSADLDDEIPFLTCWSLR
jgi:single-strand DNA-binding protein